MARTRRKLDIFDHSEELFERLKKEPSGKIRERLLAVSQGLKSELDLYEIACLVGLFRRGLIRIAKEGSKAHTRINRLIAVLRADSPQRLVKHC